LDFPLLKNVEVTIYEAVLEYPVTAGEIASDIRELKLNDRYFAVRGSGEPTEVEQIELEEEPSGEALLQDPNYNETENAKHEDYFGAEFNSQFLKDLSAAAAERKNDLGRDGVKDPDVLGTLGKVQADKSGISSPVGSK
jgi:hypothetical protein